MIKYNLRCENKHEFESWFSDSNEFEKLKNLYSIVKSRPSFKKILADRIIGVNPHSDYLKLDY